MDLIEIFNAFAVIVVFVGAFGIHKISRLIGEMIVWKVFLAAFFTILIRTITLCFTHYDIISIEPTVINAISLGLSVLASSFLSSSIILLWLKLKKVMED